MTITPQQMFVELLDEAAADGRDAGLPSLVRDARERWADELAPYIEAMADKGLQKVAKDVIRAMQESDPKQQVFPGFDVPMWFTMKTEGGYVYRPVTAATMETWLGHVEVLNEHVAAAQKKVDAQQDMIDECFAAGATQGTSVMDAMTMLLDDAH